MTAPRTVLAGALTAGAVLAPLAAWYVVGSREMAREAAVLREEPRRLAREAATAAAERLRERLETLRQSESRRPYYHYQRLYHDPRGVSAGLSLVPSPLSEGPGDPLIGAHFQVDAQGRITLPSRAEPKAAPAAALLKTRVTSLAARVRDERARGRASAGKPSPPADVAPPVQMAQGPRPEAQSMLNSAYVQNQIATRIAEAPRRPVPPLPTSAVDTSQVVILVGSFAWQALPSADGKSLVALREVITPDSALLQGFDVSARALEQAASGGALEVRFLPGPPRQPEDAGLALDGTPWHVAVDVGPAIALGERRAQKARASFRRAFGLAAASATLAGIALVALVWQSERLARQRSQLAAAAAHELRTPLAGLRIYSEMLAEGLGDPAKGQHYARQIAGEAERLGRVVTNLLCFTRLERGGLSVDPRPGDLGEAVTSGVARLEPTLVAAGARVSVSVEPGLPAVRFDPDALVQVLQNLLDNAERYSRGAADRILSVSVARDGSHARISVSDNGPGIPPELASRLFRPFVRGPQAGASPGLGLGLALVQALSQAQGGRARIEPAPGGGACVSVTLPFASS